MRQITHRLNETIDQSIVDVTEEIRLSFQMKDDFSSSFKKEDLFESILDSNYNKLSKEDKLKVIEGINKLELVQNFIKKGILNNNITYLDLMSPEEKSESGEAIENQEKIATLKDEISKLNLRLKKEDDEKKYEKALKTLLLLKKKSAESFGLQRSLSGGNFDDINKKEKEFNENIDRYEADIEQRKAKAEAGGTIEVVKDKEQEQEQEMVNLRTEISQLASEIEEAENQGDYEKTIKKLKTHRNKQIKFFKLQESLVGSYPKDMEKQDEKFEIAYQEDMKRLIRKNTDDILGEKAKKEKVKIDAAHEAGFVEDAQRNQDKKIKTSNDELARLDKQIQEEEGRGDYDKARETLDITREKYADHFRFRREIAKDRAELDNINETEKGVNLAYYRDLLRLVRKEANKSAKAKEKIPDKIVGKIYGLLVLSKEAYDIIASLTVKEFLGMKRSMWFREKEIEIPIHNKNNKKELEQKLQLQEGLRAYDDKESHGLSIAEFLEKHKEAIKKIMSRKY